MKTLIKNETSDVFIEEPYKDIFQIIVHNFNTFAVKQEEFSFVWSKNDLLRFVENIQKYIQFENERNF